MKKKIIAAALILLTVSLGGCHSHKKTASSKKPTQEVGQRETQTTSKIQQTNFKTYSCNFKCTVEGINISGQIRIEHDSIIWISVNKLLEVGRIRLTPSKIEGYSGLLSKFYSGDYASVYKKWGIDIDYATCEALIVGNSPQGINWIRKGEEGGSTILYEAKQKSKNGGNQRTWSCKVGKSDQKIEQISTATAMVGQQLNVAYTKTQKAGVDIVPSIVNINLVCKRLTTQTQVTISQPLINPSQSYPFSIPARAKSI